jgi:hypothetical protein
VEAILWGMKLAIAKPINYDKVRGIRKKKKTLYHFMTIWRKPLENIPILILPPERENTSWGIILLLNPPQTSSRSFRSYS